MSANVQNPPKKKPGRPPKCNHEFIRVRKVGNPSVVVNRCLLCGKEELVHTEIPMQEEEMPY